MARTSKNLVSLSGMTFGMPPNTHLSDEVMHNSMPQATIIPCEPVFTQGLSLFSLDQPSGWYSYKEILNSAGFDIIGNSVKVAFLADNFPTDTFNNDYGESFLDKFTDVVSGGLSDISQMFGVEKFTDFAGAITDVMGEGAASDMVNKSMDRMNKMQERLKQAAQNQNSKASGIASNVLNTANALLAGSRIDFPKVWKNSGYEPSYTMTIRLYNPVPGNAESTKKYIVGPIAALLALSVPRVAETNAQTYKWPLLCKVRAPGIYHLNAAYVNSISIIKGGDQQSIAWNQAMAMCDVRIDFGSLYNSVLAGPGSDSLSHRRPTLGGFLEAIGGKSVTSADISKQVYDISNNPPLKVANTYVRSTRTTKTNSKSQDNDPTLTPTSRVSSNYVNSSAQLQGTLSNTA